MPNEKHEQDISPPPVLLHPLQIHTEKGFDLHNVTPSPRPLPFLQTFHPGLKSADVSGEDQVKRKSQVFSSYQTSGKNHIISCSLLFVGKLI